MARSQYGKQAAYLLDYDTTKDDVIIQSPYDAMDRTEFLKMLKKRGVKVIAPSMPALLRVTDSGDIVPSPFAKDLKRMGFDIIAWTFERADLRQGASKAGYYYDFDPTGVAIKKDSDMYKALDVLAQGCEDSGHLLRLARHGDLLRQLHGLEIIEIRGGGTAKSSRSYLAATAKRLASNTLGRFPVVVKRGHLSTGQKF